jgi:CBS domain-containing protein
VTVNSGTDISAVLQAMEENQIKRLPVIEDRRLVGIISHADIARHLPQQAVGEVVEALCS